MNGARWGKGGHGVLDSKGDDTHCLGEEVGGRQALWSGLTGDPEGIFWRWSDPTCGRRSWAFSAVGPHLSFQSCCTPPSAGWDASGTLVFLLTVLHSAELNSRLTTSF